MPMQLTFNECEGNNWCEKKLPQTPDLHAAFFQIVQGLVIQIRGSSSF